MKKLTNKIRNFADKIYWNSKKAVNNFVYNEDGDTNFVSIIIILIIVLVVAGAFIAFKDEIMIKFNEIKEEFLELL